MKDVLRTVPLSPFAPIRSVIAKKMQENEEKNIKIVAGSKKSRTFATAIEKQRLQRKRVPWMSGLVSGLQNLSLIHIWILYPGIVQRVVWLLPSGFAATCPEP